MKRKEAKWELLYLDSGSLANGKRQVLVEEVGDKGHLGLRTSWLTGAGVKQIWNTAAEVKLGPQRPYVGD